MKLLSSRMSVYLYTHTHTKVQMFEIRQQSAQSVNTPASQKWSERLQAGVHAWVWWDRHRPDVSAMSYLVCGCQEELNNFFNLEKTPSSCFNCPSFPSCMLSPASGGLPVLPPPGQRPTLQQWGLICNHVCTDADVKCGWVKFGDVCQKASLYLWWWRWHRLLSPPRRPHPQRSSWVELFVCLLDSWTENSQVFIFYCKFQQYKEHPEDLLGYFHFNMNIMVSEAVAADTGDSLSSQADSLVCLDPCWDLKTRTKAEF